LKGQIHGDESKSEAFPGPDPDFDRPESPGRVDDRWAAEAATPPTLQLPRLWEPGAAIGLGDWSR